MLESVRLAVFQNLFSSIADEMGVTIQRSAYSPNIKERKDFSCAIFSPQGEMVAQAAHIPVHLGSMPLSVRAALDMYHFEPGDVVILNDPYMGGTHLPDITMIMPVFADGRLIAFAANRAHHNDVGGMSPGSMPLAEDIFQEGIRIPPVRLYRRGELNDDIMRLLTANVRVPRERKADLEAQVAGNRRAVQRLSELALKYGPEELLAQMDRLLDYTEALTRRCIEAIPDGTYTFEDFLDDDGRGTESIPIRVTLTVKGSTAHLDFSESAPEVAGPVNCVYAVTLSAVAYAFRCLMDADAPTNGGTFRAFTVEAPAGTVVNARFPSPVAGGNVETSQRIVDVVLGAFAQALPGRIPAASCGSMNNLVMGGKDAQGAAWAYYETMGGGMGAHARGDGRSAVQTHMTNTQNTPIEALEQSYPLRVRRYAVRRNSGGAGMYRGGDGIVREVEVLLPAQATLLTERRRHAPYGLAGGAPGAPGRNRLLRAGATEWVDLPPKVQLDLTPGDRLCIETPGGGGYGRPGTGDRNGEGSDGR